MDVLDSGIGPGVELLMCEKRIVETTQIICNFAKFNLNFPPVHRNQLFCRSAGDSRDGSPWAPSRDAGGHPKILFWTA